MKNTIRQKIHEVKYFSMATDENATTTSSTVKPSGKLKYMSAYRFFRRECVPQVKSENPDLDGKDRQKMIKK